MKLLDLLKVVDGGELVAVMDKAGSSGNVLATGHGEAFIRGENSDPSLLRKEVVSVFVAVVEPYGLPGLYVTVR